MKYLFGVLRFYGQILKVGIPILGLYLLGIIFSALAGMTIAVWLERCWKFLHH